MVEARGRDVELIFTYLNAMVRTAALYLPAHPQTRKAKDNLFQALTAHLSTQGTLTFRFLGDLLVANDRILPRESLVYRRLIDGCQTEKGIGSLTFRPGLEAGEIDTVLEALTEGVGDDLPGWATRRRLLHVTIGPPLSPDGQGGELMARRAYGGAVDTLREIEATIRSRSPLSVEHIGTLRVYSNAILEQALTDPALVLRLASIKSYDEYTLYHSVNVGVICMGLGLIIGLPDGVLRELALVGMLHDIGKIAIPLDVLRKPGLLDEAEWRIMRRHPVLGADLLARMPGSNRLPMVAAFEHHMRFDAKGYPFIREGWIQHPVSRVVCVADVFDAMTSRRTYKRAIPIENVCTFFRDEAGGMFDPRLVRAFEQILTRLRTDGPRGTTP
jgi:HD-GYP domain-containing protein (c-di-GMP phosphodiesterase class II)